MGKRVGVLGSGMVAKTLAGGFRKHGYEVKLGSRDPGKLAAAAAEIGATSGTVADVAAWGEIVVLAVKGTAALEAIRAAGLENLAGKTVIDTCNPIADEPPQNGVLRYFTGGNDSLMERLQAAVPNAKFVKAFSCVGNMFMVNPDFPGGPPSMFICGNDAGAKAEVGSVLDRFGWATVDVGQVESARAIEPLCQLWCLPGLRANEWSHALKWLTK